MLLTPRYLPRLAATVGLFTKYGLADFAQRQGFRALAPEEFNGADPSDGDVAERAAAFRKRLVELGPAYVKLGQVLSTRPDLLPESYIRELERLQDDVAEIPFDDVAATIEAELGARLSKLFVHFDEEPVGTASLGQGIDMVGVIQQLQRALADELDYRVEARNAASFRRALAGYPRLLIPKVIEAYTTEKVLTTERIRGMKIDAVSPLTRIEHDFRPVAEELTQAYLKMITLDGHFHADPHPGNIFIVLPEHENPMTPSEVVANERRSAPRPAVTPLARIEEQARQNAAPQPPDVDAKLAMIDFGMTARLSTTMREGIVRLLLSISDNRGDDAAATLIEIGDTLNTFDRTAYTRDTAQVIARNYDLAVGEVEAGKILYELIISAYQPGLLLTAEPT